MADQEQAADAPPPESDSQKEQVEPNNTLYIKNIDWKVKKNLVKRALYALFTRHGKVLEVIVSRKDGLRGQAFVIFDDVEAATVAMQKEQNFVFFDKELQIQYAKHKSKRVVKRSSDGRNVIRSSTAKKQKAS